MKRALLILLAVTAVSVASADNLKSAINKMNVQVTSALKHKDMARFEKITRNGITSDFKYTEMGHSQTYDEMLAQMKQSFAMIKKLSVASAKTDHIKIHGNDATSMSHHLMVGTMVGPDKKNHKMVMSGTTKDAYRKESGKWKMSEMNWVKENMTVDGKPYNPGAPAGGH